ncbi:hypothetical protein P0D69_22200 [Paraburkholderia sediminicola]|uniref:hypothetical protein n=1 Tax=Paraburkholderia sediminicola TaxID=458836 RepID=UPI0038BAA979
MVFAGYFGLCCIGENVVAAHNLDPAVENVPAPFADGTFLGRAGLVTGASVYGP